MAAMMKILTVDLYDNLLTEKVGDYTGKLRITGTLRMIVKKSHIYRLPVLLTVGRNESVTESYKSPLLFPCQRCY